MTNSEDQNISSPSRPVVLSLLCMITFVVGSLKLVLFLLAAFRSIPDYSGKNINGLLNLFLGINSTFYLTAWIALTVVTMTGAALMWNLKKSGFYIYVLAVCFTYLLPAISSGAEMMTLQRLFITSVFIFFYGIHLKFMN